MGVFLYVTALGHALIDRELYVPENWCQDVPRRRAAHIPDTLTFARHSQLAQRMVQRVQAAGLQIHWVVADTVYGHCPDLCDFLEEQGYAYALAVLSMKPCVCRPAQACCSVMSPALRTRRWCPGVAAPLWEPGHQRRAPL